MADNREKGPLRLAEDRRSQGLKFLPCIEEAPLVGVVLHAEEIEPETVSETHRVPCVGEVARRPTHSQPAPRSARHPDTFITKKPGH